MYVRYSTKKRPNFLELRLREVHGIIVLGSSR
jgi:hypothetical protein